MIEAKRLYIKFKKRFGCDVLFIREGDFYEAFFDDAKYCSQIMGIPLSERTNGGEIVPVVAIEFWMIGQCAEKMQTAGCTVGLCEQIKIGETKRDVVRRYIQTR